MSVNELLADTLLQYIAQQQQQLFDFIESVGWWVILAPVPS